MQKNIKQLLAAILPAAKDWKLYLLRNWREIIGPLHTKMTIEKVLDDVIVFGVYDSCWMQELYLLSPLLLQTINKSLDHPHIKQVRFKRAKRRVSRNPRPTPSGERPPEKRAQLPTPHEAQALEGVQDEELRDVLEAFRTRCYGEK